MPVVLDFWIMDGFSLVMVITSLVGSSGNVSTKIPGSINGENWVGSTNELLPMVTLEYSPKDFPSHTISRLMIIFFVCILKIRYVPLGCDGQYPTNISTMPLFCNLG